MLDVQVGIPLFELTTLNSFSPSLGHLFLNHWVLRVPRLVAYKGNLVFGMKSCHTLRAHAPGFPLKDENGTVHKLFVQALIGFHKRFRNHTNQKG